jgi:hypothetical protein
VTLVRFDAAYHGVFKCNRPMGRMRHGWSMSSFQASQQWATMSSWLRKTRFESQLSRRNCQTFSTGLSSGERGGSGRSVVLSGTGELAGEVPARPVEQKDGVGAGRDRGSDFEEVARHSLGVAPGHDEAGTLALGRADGAEDVGPLRALVVGRPRPGAAPRPSHG